MLFGGLAFHPASSPPSRLVYVFAIQLLTFLALDFLALVSLLSQHLFSPAKLCLLLFGGLAFRLFSNHHARLVSTFALGLLARLSLAALEEAFEVAFEEAFEVAFEVVHYTGRRSLTLPRNLVIGDSKCTCTTSPKVKGICRSH